MEEELGSTNSSVAVPPDKSHVTSMLGCDARTRKRRTFHADGLSSKLEDSCAFGASAFEGEGKGEGEEKGKDV